MKKAFKSIIFSDIVVWMILLLVCFLEELFGVKDTYILGLVILAFVPWIIRAWLYLSKFYMVEHILKMLAMILVDMLVAVIIGLILINFLYEGKYSENEFFSGFCLNVYLIGSIFLLYIIVCSLITIFSLVVNKFLFAKLSWKRVFVVPVLSLIIILVILFWFKEEHPTYYKYRDKAVIGHSLEKVEELYGKFNCGGSNYDYVGYYIYSGNDVDYYYVMYYKDNIITSVSVEPGRSGRIFEFLK